MLVLRGERAYTEASALAQGAFAREATQTGGMGIQQLTYVLVGKPSRIAILMRVTILIVALCVSGPVLVRWWRALLDVL